jgi:formylglycine-generating enzyme required for sulfatase activity
MVILIASDDAGASQALAEYLAGLGQHRIFSVHTLEDLEETAVITEKLDVLLFNAAFRAGRAKDLRGEMRIKFPGLQTALISGEDGKPVPLKQVSDWVCGLENDATMADAPEPVVLGDYELKEKRRSTTTTDSFRALQRSMKREVLLERLKPELCDDRVAVRAFRAKVRAQANVSCPWIAAVYEAQETDGAIFYTRELVKGQNLEELAAAGNRMTSEETLHLLRAAGEAMTWLAERNLPRESLERYHLYHGTDGAPRIANVASAESPPAGEAIEIKLIAEAVSRVTEFKGSPAREAAHVLGLMRASAPQGLTTWKAVLREARAGLQRLTETQTALLAEARDGPRPHRRKRRTALIIGVIVALAGAGSAVAWFAIRNSRNTPARKSLVQKHVPGGEFTFREGTKVSVPEFWIDSHEVTISQYVEFLASNHGTEFDHADQPKNKRGHEPRDWADFLPAARTGGMWHGCRITLDCPVFNVDWWDAYAYAASKGRRLPTEQEWEKAARGTSGNRWPWGNDEDLKRANTGADSDAKMPGKGGTIDGYAGWCEVDAMTTDESAFGVVGMAGNVSEWTSTWVPDPELPDDTVPVFRGGDFSHPTVAPLSTQWLAKGASYAQPFLGFRTVSSSPPPSPPAK